MALAAAIVDAARGRCSLDEGVRRFEGDMFVRARKLQQLSDDLCRDWMFTPGAPRSVIARALSRHVNKNLPAVLHPLSLMGLSSYFFLRHLVT